MIPNNHPLSRTFLMEHNDEMNEMVVGCLKFIQQKLEHDDLELDDSERCHDEKSELLDDKMHSGERSFLHDHDTFDDSLLQSQIEEDLKEQLMKIGYNADDENDISKASFHNHHENKLEKLNDTNQRALILIQQCIKQNRENFANIVWREWSNQFSHLISEEESVNEIVWSTGLNLLKSFLPIAEEDNKCNNKTEETNDASMCFMDLKNMENYALYIQYLLAAENSQHRYEDFLDIVDWFFAYNSPSEETIGCVLNAYGSYLIAGNHAFVMFDLIARNRHTFENNVDLTLYEEIINACGIQVKEKNQWSQIYTFRKEWLIEMFEKYGTTISENCFLELTAEICFSIVDDYTIDREATSTSAEIDFFSDDNLLTNNDKQEKSLKKRMEYLERIRMLTLKLPHLRDRFIDRFGDENAQEIVNAICLGTTLSNTSCEMSLLDLSLLKLIEQQRYEIEQMNKRHEDLIVHIQKQDKVISSLVHAVNQLCNR
ncbi:hypothetical protein C9374_013741 [Naegleria lovaniensis]|uniref:Uncharacterized protein n=1 Tax=Naegleria lovaniensis TaxID=51637 RepID=A0AA88GBQ2_NAELO|nr:uncharacterized protein C9374_013741 [Naegleria lovaniensis]KAG2370906.1 hypothetical protein C9374_013741 [Naegleria lovaniensis]